MNFQKLELQGFKSFADKTEITFEDGITIIVGPNGCGKSNVSDAIRWVLGEQRPTSMRGESMTDVIFNGTEVRRSLSYCEVSLYFDNRSRIFPIEFDDVVLTRKIDRSGVGEYFINHNKCRLKDIVTLLHDTGIGREGYSIIGQGRVDQIIHAKPLERRSIFEEAAGISGFKARRIEAERKLKRAEESLSRVHDILHEIEVRLKPLSKQAENAQKYNELYAELKQLEVNYFIYRYENNKTSIDSITAKLQDIILKTNEAEQEYMNNEEKYEKHKASILDIDDEINNLNDELLRLKVDLEHVAGESKIYAERAISVNNEIVRLEGELAKLDTDMEEKSGELVKRVNEKELKTKRINELTAEMDENQAKLDELTAKLSSDETEIENTNKKIILTAEELANIKSNLSKYLAERDINAKRLEFLKGVVKDKKAVLEKEYTTKAMLESNNTKLKNEKLKLTMRHNECVEERNDKREALNNFLEDKNKLNARISALETRYSMNIQIKENYEYYGRAIKRLMNDFKVNPELARRSKGLVAELISTPEGMEAAMDTAFGNTLQNIVTADEDDAKYIIDFLKRKGYGRITFQPMSVIRGRYPDSRQKQALREHGVIGFAADLIKYDSEFEGIIRGILGTTLVVNNIDTAIRISKMYRYMFKIVTLDGDIIAQHGAITGGSRKPDTANILSKDREIATIKESLDKAHKAYDKLMRMCVEAEQAITENEKAIKETETDIADLAVQFSVSEEKLNISSQNIENMEADIQTQADEISELSRIIKETEEKLALADKLEVDMKEQRMKADELVAKSKTEVGTNKQLMTELSNKVVGLRVQIAELKADIDQNEIDVVRLKKECQSINTTILDVKSYLASNKANLEKIESMNKRRSISDADKAKIDGLEQKIKDYRTKKNTAQNEVVEIDKRRDVLNKEINKLKEKRFKEQGILDQINNEIKYLHEHIWEEYELTYKTAVDFRDENFEIENAKQNINNLKRQIGRLGDINPHAIEEYNEVKERYDKETAQCEDLEKAKEDLLKIINDLTDEMTERFDKAFVQINENYKVAFKELFGGGRGHLEIIHSDSDNPLEAGIEIYAQPPGKKLNVITLLSGGEKTLTAIAILFAIIKLRPMPFCVLDEIDTALDDANAGYLAEYLKRFSEKTQFIIITHRKPTMEISDNIFGVSMEEKGVSRLVSVNLTEALKYVQEGA